MRYLFYFLFVIPSFSYSQFAAAVGSIGSTAISKDSSCFIAWASICKVERGWQDIANESLGKVTAGLESDGTGKAGENGIVSLGDGGKATLTFDRAISNGIGFDFAVFENGFNVGGNKLAFLELAFVEVSSDGEHFVRFPAISHLPNDSQLHMQPVDCSFINNFAGKYIAGYGTPFDLEELKDSAALNISHITHVRIIDVIGNIQSNYCTRDAENNIINDPYPTAFATGGFDLDAVGVIHNEVTSSIAENAPSLIRFYPNPVSTFLFIEGKYSSAYEIMNLHGEIVASGKIENQQMETISLETLANGMYILQSGNWRWKLIKE